MDDMEVPMHWFRNPVQTAATELVKSIDEGA